MADPLSIAASVAGLITLGTSIAQAGYSYLSSARAAPKEIAQLLSQISALNIVLSQLLPISMNQTSSSKSHALAALNQRGTLVECQGALNSISSLLSEFQQVEGHTKANVAKSLKWPFYEGKAERLVMRLDRLQNLLHLAIAVDSESSLQRLEQQLEDLQQDQQDGFQNLLNLNQSMLEHLKETHGDVQSTRHALKGSGYKNVLTWLSVIDPWPKHRAIRALHQPGTGTWIFEEPVFLDWLKHGYCLWVNAGNGFGKTILASTIIEQLHSGLLSPRQAVAYHYCDFRTAISLNSTNILGSIVRQVVSQSPQLPSVVQTLYDDLVNIRAPGIDDFQDLLAKMSGTSSEMIYIIVDGLDECSDRKSFLQAISGLSESSVKQNFRILVTSRPNQDIRQTFEKMKSSIFGVGPDQIAKDVELHVQTEILKQPKLSKLPHDIKESTRKSITSGAHGMFRWVSCQLDVLSRARSTAAIRRALTELPTGLDETYDRIFSQIQEDDRPLVRRALQWLIACMRPVTLLELAEAVTIDPHTNAFEADERLIDPNELLDMCGSLVQSSLEDQVVSLAHYSVKEYLISSRLAEKESNLSFFAMTESGCSNFVATSLLVYIFHLGSQAYGPTSPVQVIDLMESDYPLYDYARYLWRSHCSYGNFKSGKGWFRQFFTATLDSQPTSWIAAVNENMALSNLRFINPSPSSFIRNAAEFFLLSFIEEEMRQNNNSVPNEESATLTQAIAMLGLGSTPALRTDIVLWTHLTAASQCGFQAVVQYLLGRGFSDGAESSRFNHFYSPLSLAAKVGYKGIVRLLTDSKWNQKLFHDDHGMALILAAARRGVRGKEMVEYLLDLGIDTNAPDIYGFTIHHWARHDTSIRRNLEPLLGRLDKLRSHDPHYQDLEVRRHNILQLIRNIKDTDSLMHATECGWLSACLRFEGLDEEAAIFAEQRIIPGDLIEHWWTGCDMHNAVLERSLAGTRYRCVDCFDTDLCSECHRIWESNEALDFCTGHQYVAIPRESWYQLPPGKVNQQGESIVEVLNRLEARFSKAAFP